MNIENEYINRLLTEFIGLQKENEWIEFKRNKAEHNQIGEYISALSNSASLCGKDKGYLIWGIDDKSKEIVGTSFKPSVYKIGQEELENWLSNRIQPRIDFKIIDTTFKKFHIVVFEIPRAIHQPVSFIGIEYIRCGSYKRKLQDFPEKERALWKIFDKEPYEKQITIKNISKDEVLKYIDYPTYFDLTNQPLPENSNGILGKLKSENLINEKEGGYYDITCLGGILFAKDIDQIDALRRKAIRVIVYNGKNRVKTIREQIGKYGYAIGFEGAINFINNLLPQNEIIEKALRKSERMYPEIAIRELLANALIHQDFTINGTGPIVEIFDDRIEFTNPGTPLIDTLRFIDEPPQSRNESLASFMRRINICEERGSGIDKVISEVEFYQLPAPEFIVTEQNTKVILFAYKKVCQMDKKEKIRACYQHAVLKYVSNEQMTNTSLRERFSIKSNNYPMASRIIAETIKANLIKPHDPDNTSKKHSKYVPFWA